MNLHCVNPSNVQGFQIFVSLRRPDPLPHGRRPKLGGGDLAILTDASIPCPSVYLVCPPDVATSLWDFSFLGGVRVAVFYRREHRLHAQRLERELVKVGCVGPNLSAVPRGGA